MKFGRRLLAILPHPDDEAFTMGGTLARYARENVSVYLCTLTRGERSRHRHTHSISGEEMAAIRCREVEEAAAVLGVREHVQDSFPDGGLRDLDPRILERRIRQLILRFAPTVVLTFDVQGGSGHPDHIVTHHAVKRVVLELREEHGYPQRLACTVLPRERISHWPRHIFGVPEERIDAIVEVGEWNEIEERALRAHRSVAGDVEQHNYDNWMLWDKEYFIFHGERHSPPLDDVFAALPETTRTTAADICDD